MNMAKVMALLFCLLFHFLNLGGFAHRQPPPWSKIVPPMIMAKFMALANLKDAQKLVNIIKVKDQSSENPVKFLVAV